ncbi:T6SS phospholipase effector Tle1-like catalytic domain-containing protein [Cupriavidus basilensis]|uniref:T6SS phospholipase effector Tle1-like catalytic domain-containing protein n=1 Tax=Cupriavidus basilensis TaxID=68895 RepID=UPI0039F66D1D
MSTKSPELFPTGGLRALSSREAMQRAAALARTLPMDKKPACTGQVNVGIFFDGTGNNRLEDYEGIPAEEQVKAMKAGTPPERPESFPPELRKHSNVVRLFHTHKNDADEGFYRYYIPGVGTPFAEVGDAGGMLGSAAAAGGKARILWGFIKLLNSPYDYLCKGSLIPDDQGKAIIDKLTGKFSTNWQRQNELRQWQEKLKAALRGKKPKIERINLSVFGFSRGAAQARTFANWLFEVCEPQDGGWLFAGIPIHLRFLGIFDTVASVGLADLTGNGIFEGHQDWADNTMEIHPAIERCVHYVAGHEVRACFPLDSVRVHATYPANAEEVMYPGAHSDVGGGYAPGALGISPTPDSFMSTIPGANMYQKACRAGVPLLLWDELPQNTQADLTPAQGVIADFNNYVQASAIGDGQVEDMHIRHMGLYFSYRFKYRTSYRNLPWYLAASDTHKEYLDVTSTTVLVRLGELLYRVLPSDPSYDPKAAKNSALPWSPATNDIRLQHLYKIIDNIDLSQLSAPVERLFDRYVHDSMAGFIGMGVNEYKANRMGLMKFRKVFDKNG